jgi:hypothetical protein
MGCSLAAELLPCALYVQKERVLGCPGTLMLRRARHETRLCTLALQGWPSGHPLPAPTRPKQPIALPVPPPPLPARYAGMAAQAQPPADTALRSCTARLRRAHLRVAATAVQGSAETRHHGPVPSALHSSSAAAARLHIAHPHAAVAAQRRSSLVAVAAALPATASLLELAALVAHVGLGARAGHTCGQSANSTRLTVLVLHHNNECPRPANSQLAHGAARPRTTRSEAKQARSAPGAGPKCLTASRWLLGPRSSTQSLPVGRCSASWSKVRHSPPAWRSRSTRCVSELFGLQTSLDPLPLLVA